MQFFKENPLFETTVSQLVSWCFEPSQPQRIQTTNIISHTQIIKEVKQLIFWSVELNPTSCYQLTSEWADYVRRSFTYNSRTRPSGKRFGWSADRRTLIRIHFGSRSFLFKSGGSWTLLRDRHSLRRELRQLGDMPEILSTLEVLHGAIDLLPRPFVSTQCFCSQILVNLTVLQEVYNSHRQCRPTGVARRRFSSVFVDIFLCDFAPSPILPLMNLVTLPTLPLPVVPTGLPSHDGEAAVYVFDMK